jgi:hypothetical protein
MGFPCLTIGFEGVGGGFLVYLTFPQKGNGVTEESGIRSG